MQRRRTNGCWPDMGLFVLAAFLLLALLGFPWAVALGESYTQEEEELLQAFRSGQIIRLHILANSNAPKDQCIKLHVRNRVLEAFGRRLAKTDGKTADEVFDILCAQQESMARVARIAAAELGYHGSITVEAGVLPLPEKRYGHVLLPEGQYRALRISLGSGQGRNWWCILFPQLCLALSEDDSATGEELLWQTPRIFKQWMMVAPF